MGEIRDGGDNDAPTRMSMMNVEGEERDEGERDETHAQRDRGHEQHDEGHERGNEKRKKKNTRSMGWGHKNAQCRGVRKRARDEAQG